MSLPRFKSKYEKKAFVEPNAFLNYMKERGRHPDYTVPENIIFNLLSKDLPKSDAFVVSATKKFFSSRLDILLPAGADERAGRGEAILIPFHNSVGVISQFGFGAPALTLQLELLIASGAKRFISVGTSGSLVADVKVGDLILCSRALRDEGVSHHYVSDDEFAYPSPELNQKIKSAFNSYIEQPDLKEVDWSKSEDSSPNVFPSKNVAGHNAGLQQERSGGPGRAMSLCERPTWTTDAVYRETVDEVEACRQMGIHTVDMEAAALFTVARYRGVQAASLFAVSDLLTGEEWVPHFHSMSAPLKTLLEVAIRALTR